MRKRANYLGVVALSVVGVLALGCGETGNGELGPDVEPDVGADVASDVELDTTPHEDVPDPDGDTTPSCDGVVCPESTDPCVDSWTCDPVTGECTIIVPTEVGTTCDMDGDSCTFDACDGAGNCSSTGEINTCQEEQKANPCWTHVCSNSKGCLTTQFIEGASCNDNNACSVNDTCIIGDANQETCQGTPVAVDDDNVCTDDSCVDGVVLHNPVDGIPCTVSTGQGGLCSDGDCVASGPCGCVSAADCDIGDACIVTECKECQCFVTAVNPCDDGTVCTVDVCDSITGCEHIFDYTNYCVINGPSGGGCVANGTIHPTNSCQICNTAESSVTWSSNKAACDDGNPNTCDDQCISGQCKGGTCDIGMPGDTCATAIKIQPGQPFSANTCDFTDQFTKGYCGENGPEMMINLDKTFASGQVHVTVSAWFPGMIINFRTFAATTCATGGPGHCWGEGSFGPNSFNLGVGGGAIELKELFFLIGADNGTCGPFTIAIEFTV